MAPTWKRVSRSSSRLSTEAVRRMDALPWFVALPAVQRADVGLVVQAGIAAFTRWLHDADSVPSPAPDVFGVAPRDLTRAVSLKQTVQLIRVVVGVLEEEVPILAAEGGESELREAVLRYSREIAFAAAEIYAAAAEARGAWDARLESSVVEALVRNEVGDLTLSRATSLGWGRPSWVMAVVAPLPSGHLETRLDALRAHARHSGLFVLTGEAGGGLVVLLGGKGKRATAVKQIVTMLPEGPVVVGPAADSLAAAAGSVREAIAGLAAVAAWPDAPRPTQADDLLAERVVLGDELAKNRLLANIYDPLEQAGGDLLITVSAFLSAGGSLEGTARQLFVHANTVRYRLRKVSELVGLELSDPRGAHAAQLALMLGRTRTL